MGLTWIAQLLLAKTADLGELLVPVRQLSPSARVATTLLLIRCFVFRVLPTVKAVHLRTQFAHHAKLGTT